MNPMIITDKNINDVYTRLRKFFYNRNQTGFEAWHDYDCGFKKRIKRYIDEEGNRLDAQRYPAPVMITLEGNRSYGRCISVQLVAGEGFELCCGDKIAFYGNRIVCRTDWPHNDSIKYIYSTFQACPMTQEEQESIHLMAEGWMVDEY